jgi:tetratricopeptide (TPR) repeat protein
MQHAFALFVTLDFYIFRPFTMKTHTRRAVTPLSLAIVLIVGGVIGSSAGCGPGRRDLEEQAASQAATAEKYFNDRKYSEALAATREAIRLNTSLREDSVLADNYLLLANCQRQLGDYDSALVGFENTIEYFHSLNDQHLERRARIGLAEFYGAMLRDVDAITIASDAAASANVFSDFGDAYRALMTVARSSHRLGRYDDESAALAELSKIDSQAHGGRDRLLLLRMKMESAVGAGDPAASGVIFTRWRDLAASKGDTSSLAEAYYERGLTMLSAGRPDSAFLAFSKGLGYAGKPRNLLPLQEEILTALGNLSYGAKRYDDARRYYADALELAKRADSFALKEILDLAIVACESKSEGALSQGTAAGLVKRCAAAAGECSQNGFRAGEALANFISGRLLESTADQAAAVPAYRRALTLSGGLFIPPDAMSLDFIDTYMEGEGTGWADPLIRLFCVSGQTDSVFAAVEQRNLSDLAEFYSRIEFKTGDQRLNQAISAVQWNLNALQLLQQDLIEELGSGFRTISERLASLNKSYPDRVSKLARSVGSLAAVNSNFPWLLCPGRLQLSAIRDTLPQNAALLEFAPTRDALYVFVISRRGSVLRRAPVNLGSLLSFIRDYNRLAGENRLNSNGTWITDPAIQSRLNGLSSVLGKLLLAPVAQDLNGVEKLYVSLPREFGWLPLHTLRWDERPLAAHMNVSYVPTAAALLFSSLPERPARRVLGIGHPGRTSWDVEYELKDIRGFYDSAPMLFNAMATLNHLMDSLYDVIHISAEFQLDTQVPDNSKLLLADGITPFGVRGATLGELLAVPKPQALVLSNISARPGAFSRYAPLIFLANGTRTIVASEWQVDRKAKKYFGEGFYTALLGGVSTGDAYRHAVEALLKQGEFSLLQRWGAYYRYGR